MSKGIWIASCIALTITGATLCRYLVNNSEDNLVELVVTVSSPGPEEAKRVVLEEQMETLDENECEEENFLSDHVVVPIYQEGTTEPIGSYAYINIEKTDMIEMNRQDYYSITDIVSQLEYEYFTIVFEDGEGIVYHPQYAYWAAYASLDENYYIKDVISYIDSTENQVETVTESKTEEVGEFIEEITEEYRYAGWYKSDVSFLYDNMYQANLTLNIEPEQLDDIAKVVKALEQKTNVKGYKVNFCVQFVSMGKEVVTMTFGEEYLKYIYVENGHRIVLDSLE